MRSSRTSGRACRRRVGRIGNDNALPCRRAGKHGARPTRRCGTPDRRRCPGPAGTPFLHACAIAAVALAAGWAAAPAYAQEPAPLPSPEDVGPGGAEEPPGGPGSAGGSGGAAGPGNTTDPGGGIRPGGGVSPGAQGQREPGIAQESAPGEPLIDPHYLLDFLPDTLSGVPRADTRTGLDRGVPVAAAVYAGDGTRREIAIHQLWGDAGRRILAELRQSSADGANAEDAGGPAAGDGGSVTVAGTGYRLMERSGPQGRRRGYAIAPEERFMITVSGSLADAGQAESLLSEVDLSGLLAFEPPGQGYETAELYADAVPMTVRYPAPWILVDAGRTGGFARMLLLMSEPIEPAQLIEEPTSLLLGRRIAATIGVLPAQDNFSTRDYMIRTPSLLPYRFRQLRPTIRPERAAEYGEEAGFAAFRALDFEGNPVQVRELVYRPGDRYVQLHLIVPERVEFGTESVLRELANGIRVQLP